MSADEQLLKNRNDMVYMTVLTNEKYLPGVKALKNSLKKVKSQYNLVVLIPQSIETLLRGLLEKFNILDDYCILSVKEDLRIKYPVGVQFEEHYWSDTFFKLCVANCTEYKKIILLDSDMLILRNIDHLFSKPSYSAAIAGKCAFPEWTKFNSGLMVIEPSKELYTRLIDSVQPAMYRRFNEGNNIGDQDVFQEAFCDWENHKELLLPEVYNCLFKTIRILKAKEKISLNDIAVVHFIGGEKPWSYGCFTLKNFKQCLYFVKNFKLFELKIYFRYLRYSCL